MNGVSVRKSQQADCSAVRALLESASLPTAGVAEHFQDFFVAERDGTIVGTIGLEKYGNTGLLRSAVVHPSLQNKGIGSLLYNTLIEEATDHSLERLILLTTTAEKYFAKRGFRTIDQNSVTGAITQSAEFTGACPSTAVCMELHL